MRTSGVKWLSVVVELATKYSRIIVEWPCSFSRLIMMNSQMPMAKMIFNIFVEFIILNVSKSVVNSYDEHPIPIYGTNRQINYNIFFVNREDAVIILKVGFNANCYTRCTYIYAIKWWWKEEKNLLLITTMYNTIFR